MYSAALAEPKHSHFKRGIHVSSAIPHTSLRGAPLLVGDTAEMVSPSATNTEFDADNYIPRCTV